MIKIGIIGHSKEHFSNFPQYEVSSVIGALKRQYDNFQLNIFEDTGIGHAVGIEALELSIPYSLWAKYVGDRHDYLLDDQYQQFLNLSINAVDICLSQTSHLDLVDNSNFLIVFWNGKHIGSTYDSMTYALKSGKIVLNGLGNLAMLSISEVSIDK